MTKTKTKAIYIRHPYRRILNIKKKLICTNNEIFYKLVIFFSFIYSIMSNIGNDEISIKLLKFCR